MPTIVRAPNRAKDAAVVERVEKELAPFIRRTREDKATLHGIAMRHWNVWAARHDSNAYHGRLKAYLTTGRRVIENWVAMLKRAEFPVSGKWFEVSARTVKSEDRAPTVQSLFQRELTQYMQIRRKASPYLRGCVILGTQPMDVGWRVSGRDVPTVDEIRQEAGGRSVVRLEDTIKRVVSYLGPTLRPIDFFRWYVWPTTVNDVEDADLCFEDWLQNPAELASLTTRPILEGQEKDLGFHIDPKQWKRAQELIPRGDRAGEILQEQRTRLAARGFNSPTTRADDAALLLDCTKGYWRASFDDDEPPSWYEFILAGDSIPLRVRETSLGLMGDPSYLALKFVEVWEEFYGYGLPTAFDSQQYFLNDVFNQGGDALTWALNPIAAIDPDALQDHTQLAMKPGAKWLVRLPRQSVVWMEPPKESAQAALATVQQMNALINDTGGVQPFAPGGKTSGKGRSIETLGGLQILASEGQLQIADVVQNHEDTFYNRMLRRMYDLNVQCLDEAILLNVAGVRGAALIETNVTRKNLIGEFDLRWLASTYQYNQEVRTQQMSGFLQVMSRIPPEVLAQDNTRFRVGEFLKVFYSEGLLLPHADRIFQDAQPVRAVAAELENGLYRQGHADDVTVSPADNDMEHMQSHVGLLMDPTLDPAIQSAVMQHVQQHVLAMIAKQQMVMQQSAMQAAGMSMPPNGDPNAGGNGSDRLALPDAPGRMAATASMDDIARRQPRPGGQGPGGFA